MAIFFAVTALDTSAQELEPRLYSNTPVGMNFLLAGYAYAAGSVLTDPSISLENANIETHNVVLGYARALDVWGTSGKIDVILPYSWASGPADSEGQHYERDVSGLADPRFRFSVNLYGAPALTLEEFRNYRQDLIVGVSLQVSVPLGQYDDDRLLNIGTNRWSIKPELGISKALGSFIVEFSAAANFYTDNDDFFWWQHAYTGPVVSLEGHVIYSFESGIWIAVDGTYYTGGRTSVDGVENDDLQSNSRLGITAAFPVDSRNSLKPYASTGISARTGSNFDAVGLAWQYRWGGGL